MHSCLQEASSRRSPGPGQGELGAAACVIRAGFLSAPGGRVRKQSQWLTGEALTDRTLRWVSSLQAASSSQVRASWHLGWQIADLEM